VVRAVSTVRRKKQVPGKKLVWVWFWERKLTFAVARANQISSRLPRASAPTRTNTSHAVSRMKTSPSNDGLEVVGICVNYGTLASFRRTIDRTYLVGWRSGDFPNLRVTRVYASPPCPVRCVGVLPVTVAEDRPKHLVFVVHALVKDNYTPGITAEAIGVFKSCRLFLGPCTSSIPHVKHLNYAQTIQAIAEARA